MIKQEMIVRWEKCLCTTGEEDIRLLLIHLQNYKLMIFNGTLKVPQAIM